MWYFAWILGLPLAALVAVANAIWLELRLDQRLLQGDEITEDLIAKPGSTARDPRRGV